MVFILLSDWSTGHPLLPDFFLDEAPEALAKKMEQHGERFSPNALSFTASLCLRAEFLA